MRKILILLSLAIAQPGYAQAATDNPDMTRIFDADQELRKQDFSKLDGRAVIASDAERRAAAQALLDAGKLTTATDFWHAAFVFQHGSKPEDYLLAHSLAVAAAARGRADAAWIAAASLDRYLGAIGRPQIYGTQFRGTDNGSITQEPYDRALVSDQLRTVMGVPVLAAQEKRRIGLEKARSK